MEEKKRKIDRLSDNESKGFLRLEVSINNLLRKISKEKTESRAAFLINVFSCMISVCMAILSFNTLSEMRLQRENTYIADLFIKDAQVKIEDDLFKEYDMQLDEYWELEEYFPFIRFEICNIGEYAAKNITIVFNEENNKRLREILLSPYAKKKVTIIEDAVPIPALEFDDKRYLLNEYTEYNIDFILPMSQTDGEHTYFFLPVSYGLMLKFIMQVHNTKSLYDSTDNNPYITLTVNYQDVKGKEYSKDVKVKMDLRQSMDNVTELFFYIIQK